MRDDNLALSEKWQLTYCECNASLVLLQIGNKMAQWLKMWWIIGCKCHGSAVVDMKAYFLFVYLVTWWHILQYWLIVEDVVAHWLYVGDSCEQVFGHEILEMYNQRSCMMRWFSIGRQTILSFCYMLQFFVGVSQHNWTSPSMSHMY